MQVGDVDGWWKNLDGEHEVPHSLHHHFAQFSSPTHTLVILDAYKYLRSGVHGSWIWMPH